MFELLTIIFSLILIAIIVAIFELILGKIKLKDYIKELRKCFSLPFRIIEGVASKLADFIEFGDGGGDAIRISENLYRKIRESVLKCKITSPSEIQRMYRIGYAESSRYVDKLEEEGIVRRMKNGKCEVLRQKQGKTGDSQ